MKRVLHFFLLLPLLMACSNEDDITMAEGEGRLVINNVVRQEIAKSSVHTRSAVDADLALEILDAEGNVYRGMQYVAGAALPQTFSLIVGDYTLRAYTENQTTWTTDNDGRGSAIYEGEEHFGIEADWVTYVNLAVPMINYGVTYTVPEHFDEWFPTCEFTVGCGDRSCQLTTGQTAYFDPADAYFAFSLHLINSEGEEYDVELQTYDNPKAGIIYNVNLGFASDDDPTKLKIGISYDDTYEEIVHEITLY